MNEKKLIKEENKNIPQWQIDAVRATKEKIDKNPSLLKDWNTVKKNIKSRQLPSTSL